MVVSKQTIIHKMINELQLAKEEDGQVLQQRIASVRLLCDLMLEESSPVEREKLANEKKITDQELKAMMGESSKHPSASKQTFADDANGDSIFDF